MNEPPKDFIEHIPGERREPWWSWWAIWAGVAAFWLLYLGDEFNWEQVGLGLVTGVFLGAWAMDMTGGQVPESWRKATRRR